MSSEENKRSEGERALLVAARESVQRLIEVVRRDEAEFAGRAAAAEKVEETGAPSREGAARLTAGSLREGADAYRRVAEAARRLAEGIENAERARGDGEGS